MAARPRSTTGHLFATDLRCDGRGDPIDVFDPQPTLSWTPATRGRPSRQRAAQVLVSSDPERLAAGVGDRWDSGRVEGTAAAGLSYAGSELRSGTRSWWSVRLWDERDRPSEFCAAAAFEMALLAPDDWSGEWIAAASGISSPLLRTTFELDAAVELARAHVVGLGYHQLRVNGQAPDDRVLHPAPSYADDTLTAELGPRPRTKAAVYDIGHLLQQGENVIGVVLGHGWFSAEADVPPSPYHRDPYGERPVLLADIHIELESGERVRIASGPDWTTKPGPILYNDYSHGETYDARLDPIGWDDRGFATSGWVPVESVAGPNGPAAGQRTPPSRVIETRPMAEVPSPDRGVRMFDGRQHLTGWSRIVVRGAAGSTVILRHASRLDNQGRLDTANHELAGHVARQTDRYELRGDEQETWEPRFTLHGFRFVEVATEGDCAIEQIDARVVHSDLVAAGAFESSDALLGRIYDNTRWTFRASFQGFPQDAADRSERVGWLGDPGFLAEDVLYDFDCSSFWADWLDDISDAQLADGQLPVVAAPHWRVPHRGQPNTFSYTLYPDWMATYPLMVWQHYRFYADPGLLRRHYRPMARFIDWMAAQAPDHILSLGLGDHMEPQSDGSSRFSPLRTPAALTSTALFYACARIVESVARLLEEEADASRFDRLAKVIRRTYNRRFFDRAGGRYATGSQTANAISTWLGLTPRGREADVVADIVRDIRERGGHLDTGIIGSAALEQTLPLHGAAGVMLDVMRQTTFPSWGHQIEMGATTLWETWGDDPPHHSQNMKMLGAVPTFLYRDVAGITLDSPGWRDILIHPKVTGRLEHARARVRTARGDASVEWRHLEGELAVDVEIPASSRASVRLSTGNEDAVVRVGDDVIWSDDRGPGRHPGVRGVTRRLDRVDVRLDGGSFEFRVRRSPAREGRASG